MSMFDEQEIDAEDLPNFRYADQNQKSGFVVADGDGDSDEEGEFVSSAPGFPYHAMPEVVKNFIVFFHRHFKDQNVYEVHAIYENHWPKLTERYFKASAWPPAESIAHLVEQDGLFLLLYKELYYRHIYAKLTPSAEQRVDSWLNYTALFQYLLQARTHWDVDLDLPVQWLWDIIDEFLQQFVEAQQQASSDDAWAPRRVLSFLERLVEKSTIRAELQKEQAISASSGGGATAAKAEGFGSHPVYRVLGYFALIGLTRVHCLLGDYGDALRAVSPIDMSKKGLFTRVTACHISLHYHLAFAYLMTRRYVDSIKALSHILLYISRTKQYHTKSAQYEQILRRNEQMYAMLAMAVSLSPQRIDENVHSVLRDKHSDRMLRMLRGELHVYEELFSQCAPKFVPPCTAAVAAAGAKADGGDSGGADRAREAHQLQARVFMAEVAQQALLPTIRSFLKLYKTISLERLASFLEVDVPTCRTALIAFKMRAMQQVCVDGNPSNARWERNTTDINFYIDRDMIYISTTNVEPRTSQYFLRHLAKLQKS